MNDAIDANNPKTELPLWDQPSAKLTNKLIFGFLGFVAPVLILAGGLYSHYSNSSPSKKAVRPTPAEMRAAPADPFKGKYNPSSPLMEGNDPAVVALKNAIKGLHSTLNTSDNRLKLIWAGPTTVLAAKWNAEKDALEMYTVTLTYTSPKQGKPITAQNFALKLDTTIQALGIGKRLKLTNPEGKVAAQLMVTATGLEWNGRNYPIVK